MRLYYLVYYQGLADYGFNRCNRHRGPNLIIVIVGFMQTIEHTKWTSSAWIRNVQFNRHRNNRANVNAQSIPSSSQNMRRQMIVAIKIVMTEVS